MKGEKKKQEFVTEMTKNQLQKLEEQFLLNVDDESACFYAGISPRKLYYYQEQNPEYLQRKKALKNMPKVKAKKNINNSLDEGDVKTSMWLLEHTDEDFKTRSTTDLNIKEARIEFKAGQEEQVKAIKDL